MKKNLCGMAFIALTLVSSAAWASDGVLEINQACALNGGCFGGDSPGYPVAIDSPGSYRLTGNLDLTGIPDTIAIQIDAPHVTLDLNGFEIAGPVICTGSGPTLDCGAPGSATGIRLNGAAQGALIRNGTIRNMNSSGVGSSGAHSTTLKELRAYNNARDGLNGGNSSVVTDCIAVENGDDGFDFGIGAVIERSTAEGNGNNGIEIDAQRGVVSRSTTRRNGGRGFELGAWAEFADNTSDFNTLPDRCGGGICSARQRFYVTQNLVNGNQVLDACMDGFHTASIWEIGDFEHLAYDTALGAVTSDSGSGAPRRSGWVRTGEEGGVNCDDWTSANFADTGTTILFIQAASINSDSSHQSPWLYTPVTCNSDVGVWCIED